MSDKGNLFPNLSPNCGGRGWRTGGKWIVYLHRLIFSQLSSTDWENLEKNLKLFFFEIREFLCFLFSDSEQPRYDKGNDIPETSRAMAQLQPLACKLYLSVSPRKQLFVLNNSFKMFIYKEFPQAWQSKILS